MPSVSLLIACRNSAGDVEAVLPRLTGQLAAIKTKYEIICIDDGSSPEQQQLLRVALAGYRNCHMLASTSRYGLSAAVRAGLAVSEGQYVGAFPIEPRYSPAVIESLWSRLARFDIVFAKTRRTYLGRSRQRVMRLGRAVTQGLDVHDPDYRCWIARAEAVVSWRRISASLNQLPMTATLRGYRVGEVAVPQRSVRYKLRDPRWIGFSRSSPVPVDAYQECSLVQQIVTPDGINSTDRQLGRRRSA